MDSLTSATNVIHVLWEDFPRQMLVGLPPAMAATYVDTFWGKPLAEVKTWKVASRKAIGVCDSAVAERNNTNLQNICAVHAPGYNARQLAMTMRGASTGPLLPDI